MGICSDERFAKIAAKRLGRLFPALAGRSGFHRRRGRLAETIEALIASFAARSPGWHDDPLLVDSTPVECARSRETVKRGGSSCLGDAIADAADYGWCASHSRWFWGLRLHTPMAPDGTPRAMALTSPKEGEREVCLRLLGRAKTRTLDSHASRLRAKFDPEHRCTSRRRLPTVQESRSGWLRRRWRSPTRRPAPCSTTRTALAFTACPVIRRTGPRPSCL
ncbi:MAG TPA: hypothetical protein VGC32_11245 [Solirubrobacterales bacterium]